MIEEEAAPTLAEDRIRGVAKIAAFIGEDQRRAQYLCERGIIPVGKEGAHYVALKSKLRQYYADLTSGPRQQ